MRLAVLADIHANLEALRAVARSIAGDAVDRVVCLGDVVGYNADPAACIELLMGLDPVCVAGNHDRAVTGQITTDSFDRTAARAVAWTRERLSAEHLALLAGMPLRAHLEGGVVAVHGAWHPETGCETVRLDTDERRLLSLAALKADPFGARICAFGHTHRLGVYELAGEAVLARAEEEVRLRPERHYLVNPGTVGEPRTADQRASYLVLDLERRAATVRRVSYDRAAAFRKTREAGLSPALAFLPAPVRARLKRGTRALGLTHLMGRLRG